MLFEPKGVSIEFVRKFLADNQELLETLRTTADVCEKVIKPATAEKGPYMTLLQDQVDDNGKPFTGVANVFVAHAWLFNLGETADVLEQFACENPGAYFWYDLFCHDQNIADPLPADWWSNTLNASIKVIGTVLLVLSPWNGPIPLTRVWCLWEIMCALQDDTVKFVVKLPRTQREALKLGVLERAKSILQALADIQAEKAEATKPSDKDLIFQSIEQTIGFDQVNIQVKNRLRAWYIRTLQEIGDKEAENVSEVSAKFFYNSGLALKQLGLYHEAMKFYEQALEMYIKTVGPRHSKTGNVFEITQLFAVKYFYLHALGTTTWE